jgi:hypothetical protein
MALMRREAPTYAVAGMNPNFIWQKRYRLSPAVGALGAGLQLPGIGQNHMRHKQCKEQSPVPGNSLKLQSH